MAERRMARPARRAGAQDSADAAAPKPEAPRSWIAPRAHRAGHRRGRGLRGLGMVDEATAADDGCGSLRPTSSAPTHPEGEEPSNSGGGTSRSAPGSRNPRARRRRALPTAREAPDPSAGLLRLRGRRAGVGPSQALRCHRCARGGVLRGSMDRIDSTRARRMLTRRAWVLIVLDGPRSSWHASPSPSWPVRPRRRSTPWTPRPSTRSVAAGMLAAVALLGQIDLTRGRRWALGPAVLALAASPLAVGVVRAASPPPPIGGDPRVPEGGASLIGEPVLAIVGTVAVGVGAALVTWIYVRLTPGRGPKPSPSREKSGSPPS